MGFEYDRFCANNFTLVGVRVGLKMYSTAYIVDADTNLKMKKTSIKNEKRNNRDFQIKQ